MNGGSTNGVQEAFGKAIFVYAEAVRAFVAKRLEEKYGPGRAWFDRFVESLSYQKQSNLKATVEAGQVTAPGDLIDVTHFGDVLLRQPDVFKPLLGRQHSKAITWAQEIADVRHDYAHQKPVTDDDAYRALDNMARLLVLMDCDERAAGVKALRDGLLTGARAADKPVAASSDPALQPWWKHAEPHADIRKGQFDENTFAAKLDDVVRDDGSAPPEYRRADLFFKKTYLTRELTGVLADTLRRLAGTGGESVVQLRTPFGGGKTHALIALYHLARHHADLEDADRDAILKAANLGAVPRTRVAVLVGTQLDPNGRQLDGLTLHTLWGELAFQLGGVEGYARMQAADESGIAPSKDTLIALLQGVRAQNCSALILMDELLVYQVKAAGRRVGETTLQAQSFAFLQSLSEAVAGVEGVALVTTFPESHIEYYDHHEAPGVFSRLEKIFGRVQAVRVPVQGEEIYEVIRRRLFENIDQRAAEQVAGEYSRLFDDHKDDLPAEARTREYRQKMVRAFPFHPELIDLLYEQWGSMQSFQKTRGVLRLLARVIEHGYLAGTARPLISLGDTGLEEGEMQATVTQTLGDAQWGAALASDLSAPGGRSYGLDKEQGGNYARFRLAQTVAGAVFMASHSGGDKKGITKPGLNLALLHPQGITPMLITDALDRLRGRLYYLHANGNYVFKAQANLNSVLADRTAQVGRERAEEFLRGTVQGVAGSGVFKPFVWPETHKDVSDGTGFKLVLLGPDAPLDDPEARDQKLSTVQQNVGGGPRIHKNTLVYLLGRGGDFTRAAEQARVLLALQDIERDRALALSSEQKADLKERLSKQTDTVPSLTKAAYTALRVPVVTEGGEPGWRELDITPHTKTRSTLEAAVTDVLRQEDLLISAIDPALLVSAGHWKLWPADEPHLPLGDLADYFTRLPHLPFLEDAGAVRTAIALGVKQGLFELAQFAGGEQPSNVWRRGNPPAEGDIHFNALYRLGRPGTWPKSEPIDPDPDPGPGPGPGPINPPPPPPPPSDRVRTVRLKLPAVEPAKVPALFDLFQALRDAGGAVQMQVSLQAHSPGGLDRSVLDLSVRELLDQHGLTAEWHEEN